LADCVGEVIAVAFVEADDGLDGGRPFELARDLRRDVTLGSVQNLSHFRFA